MDKFSIKGQSLIEIIIGMAIGGIFIGATAATIAFVLRSNFDARTTQIAFSLASEYLDNLQSLAYSDWQKIYAPPAAKGGDSQFHLSASGTNFVLVSGATTTVIEGKNFTRYFSIENVNRDSCGVGNITADATTLCASVGDSGIADDSSTQKITVKVDWEGGRSLSKIQYLTRNQNKVFIQTDWNSGANQEAFPSGASSTFVNSKFSSQSNINFSSAGTITISGLGGGGGSSATGTIDSTYRYAWNDVIGWVDFYATGNVNVSSTQLTGYASSSVGYIALDCATSPNGDICGTSNFKVLKDTNGNLSGYAYNDNIGWLSFSSSGAANSTSSASFTETFSATIYKDSANTTANWDTSGQLQTEPNGTSLTSNISGILGSNFIYSMVKVGDYIYIGSSNGKFLRYKINDGSVDDLTSQISSIFGTSGVSSLTFDSYRNAIYLGGDGKFARYRIFDNAADNLNSQVSGWGEIEALVFDSNANTVYLGSNYGNFARFNPSGDTMTNLTSKLPWPNWIFSLAFDSINNIVYIGAGDSSFARYNTPSYIVGGIYPNADTVYDLSSKIPYNSVTIGSLAFDSSNNVVYLGDFSGNFMKYNAVADSGSLIFNNGGNPIELSFDSSNNVVYLSGGFGYFARYNVQSDETVNLRSPDTISFWGSNDIYASVIDSLNSMIYIGGANGYFAKKPIIGYPAIARSLSVDSTANNITKAILTKNDSSGTGQINYYLSNNGGSNWSQVTPGTEYTFSTTGSDLRFKIELSKDAVVYDITIDYYEISIPPISYQVSVNPTTGDFSGWAWNDNVGWFSFNCSDSGAGGCSPADYKVKTGFTSISTSAWLESSTFDTWMVGGAAMNTIMWQGIQPSGTSVKFQIASLNNSIGPWNYKGPDGSITTYYAPTGPNIPAQINPANHNNQRYFRYKIFLYSNSGATQSPTVTDVIINWSQ